MRHAILIGTLAAAFFAATDAVAQTRLEAGAHVGFGQLTGDNDDDAELSPLIGASLGARVSDLVSVHAQLRVSFLQFDTSFDLDGTHYDVGALPLFHLLPAGLRADLVIGPTVGWYRTEIEGKVLRVPFDGSATGFYLGAIVAVYGRITDRLAVGGFFGWNREFPTEVCGRAFDLSRCDDPDDRNDSTGFLSFGASALF